LEGSLRGKHDWLTEKSGTGRKKEMEMTVRQLVGVLKGDQASRLHGGGGNANKGVDVSGAETQVWLRRAQRCEGSEEEKKKLRGKKDRFRKG